MAVFQVKIRWVVVLDLPGVATRFDLSRVQVGRNDVQSGLRVAVIRERHEFQLGQHIQLRPRADFVHLFDANTARLSPITLAPAVARIFVPRFQREQPPGRRLA